MSAHRHARARPSTESRGAVSWTPFEEYNRLEAALRPAALEQLGIRTASAEVRGILTTSHFVVPVQTRFQCLR